MLTERQMKQIYSLLSEIDREVNERNRTRRVKDITRRARLILIKANRKNDNKKQKDYGKKVYTREHHEAE